MDNGSRELPFEEFLLIDTFFKLSGVFSETISKQTSAAGNELSQNRINVLSESALKHSMQAVGYWCFVICHLSR